MIKEELEIKEEYFQLTQAILQTLLKDSQGVKSNMVITVCGESGSGKSVTAMCLVKKLKEKGFKAIVLNQDGFFHLPPKENSSKRKSDISWVGPQEVDLESMQTVIDDFRNKEAELNIRIVDYKENKISQKQLGLKEIDVIVVEGTYAFLLEGADTKIFIERTYKDTKEVRLARNREQYDPFVEKVLGIEHEIITKLGKSADLFITKDYVLYTNNREKVG